MEPSTRSSRAGKSCRSLRWQLQEARKRTSRGAPPEGGGTHTVGTFDLGGFRPHRGRLIVHTSREIRPELAVAATGGAERGLNDWLVRPLIAIDAPFRPFGVFLFGVTTVIDIETNVLRATCASPCFPECPDHVSSAYGISTLAN